MLSRPSNRNGAIMAARRNLAVRVMVSSSPRGVSQMSEVQPTSRFRTWLSFPLPFHRSVTKKTRSTFPEFLGLLAMSVNTSVTISVHRSGQKDFHQTLEIRQPGSRKIERPDRRITRNRLGRFSTGPWRTVCTSVEHLSLASGAMSTATDLEPYSGTTCLLIIDRGSPRHCLLRGRRVIGRQADIDVQDRQTEQGRRHSSGRPT